MKSAFSPTAAPLLVFVTFVSLLHSTVYGQGVDIKRCQTEEQYLDPGSYYTNCPFIQSDPESPPGHASVSDYVFVYHINFFDTGSEKDLEVRWSRQNYLHSDPFTWGPLFPQQPNSVMGYWGPCKDAHVGDSACSYSYTCGSCFPPTYAITHFPTPSKELLAEDVGTWNFTILRDGVELTPYTRTFEVHELEIAALGGENQIGIVDQNLANPLVLKLHTFDDKPVKDEVIGWSVSAPPGAQNQAVYGIGSGSETDENGIDEATIHLGTIPGVYTVTLNNRRITTQSNQSFTFIAIDDILDTNPVFEHPLFEEGTGENPEQCDAVGNPIGVSLGNKFQKEVDIASSGISPIEFVRYHNSLGYVSSSFENYWTHTYDRRIEIPADPQVDPVKVIRPDGKKVNFTWNGSGYDPFPGVESSLEETPTGWQYVDEQSVIENFDQDGLLLEIIELNGMVQAATHNQQDQLIRIESSIGTSLDFAYDGDGRLATVTDQSNRTWTYDYDILGRLQFVYRPEGTAREYHYEDLRHAYALTGITLENGVRHSTYEYDENGMAIASYLANNVNRVDIQYDANGDRIVLDPLGNATVYETNIQNKRGVLNAISGPVCSQGCGVTDTQFSYDAELNVTSKVQYGITTNYGNYDSEGQPGYVIEAVGTPEEKRTDYEYDPRFLNKITKITEPSVYPGQFKVTDRTYDASGNLTSETISGFDPSGQIVSRSRTSAYGGPYGQLSSTDGPRTDVSDITTYEYYADSSAEGANRARLKAIVDANGTRVRDNIQYTSTGKISSESRPNGITVSYQYDPDTAQVLSLTESGGGLFNRTQWEYYPTGEVQTIILDDETGAEVITRFYYDAARRLERVESRVTRTLVGQSYSYDDKQWVAYTFDGAGNIISETHDSSDAASDWIIIDRVFDAYSRIDKIIRGGITEDYDYNPDGSLGQKTDGNLNTTTYTYDAFKRLTSTQEVGQVVTAQTYDTHGNKLSVTDPENHTTSYAYDDLGNLLQRTSPDTGVTTYDYNEAGQVIGETDAKGQLTVTAYDAGGRVTSIDRVATDYDITYTYDVCSNGVGRLCSIATGWGHTLQYQWNALGQLARTTSTEGTISYTYGPSGALTAIEYPSGRIVHYDLDGGGLPQEVRLQIDDLPQVALVDTIKYSPLGRPIAWRFTNGLTTTVDLDARHRPESITVPGVWSWQATDYDGNDNLLALTTSFDAYAYGYDAQNRLTDADSAALDIDYQYDKVGNRTAKTVNTVVEAGTYEPGSNRIASYGNRDFTLDANGNTIAEQLNLNPDRTFVYSSHNRLVEAIDDASASTLATYRYDALGQRVSKTTASETRQFVYGQNGELLAILDGDDNVLHEYVYLAGTAVIDLSAYPAAQPPSLPPEVVVDEGAASVYGANWQAKSSAAAINGTYLQNRKTAGRLVQWGIDQDPNFLAGFYDVFVNWLAQDGTQTTYFVTAGAGLQQIDVLHAGHSPGDWVHLGTFEFEGQHPVYGPHQYVSLNGDSNDAGLLGTFLLADAVKVVPLLSPLDLVDLRFIHGDHLGTPQVVTDETGIVVWTATYLPFGQAVVDEDPDGDLESYELNLRFPGQYADAETGLHYNYFRSYDPETGRYRESDPVGLAGGLNTFGYSLNNPIVNFDPSGLYSCWCQNQSDTTSTWGVNASGQAGYICGYRCRCWCEGEGRVSNESRQKKFEFTLFYATSNSSSRCPAIEEIAKFNTSYTRFNPFSFWSEKAEEMHVSMNDYCKGCDE